MKAWFVGVVLVVLVCGNYAAKWYMSDPSKPGMCYDRNTRTYYKVGSFWRRPDVCEGLTCMSGDTPGTLTLSEPTCPYATRMPSKCRLVSLLPDSNYPDCCPKLSCNREPNGQIEMVV